MPRRPLSLTIICAVLITVGSLAFLLCLFAWNNLALQKDISPTSLPSTFNRIRMLVGALIVIICSIAMLNARNWARHAYITWGGINFLVGIITSPIHSLATVPNFGIFFLSIFIIFRRGAREYFSGTTNLPSDAADNTSPFTISLLDPMDAGQDHSETNSVVRVYRLPQNVSRMRQYVIYIDGKRTTTIGNGQTINFCVPTGMHSIRTRIDWFHSNTLSFHVQPDGNISFEIATRGYTRGVLILYGILATLGIMLGAAIRGPIGGGLGFGLGFFIWMVVCGGYAFRPEIYEKPFTNTKEAVDETHMDRVQHPGKLEGE